jgi:two-component system, chemotaxis family, chemotaxis protein CheY
VPSESKRALVIDDNPVDRLVLSGIVKGLGFGTEESEDGQAGLDRIAREPPFDVILVDWNMPRLDGIGFLRGVRASPKGSKVRIIMVTGETELSSLRKALEAGADEYLMKPYNREAIQLKLRMLGLAV